MRKITSGAFALILYMTLGTGGAAAQESEAERTRSVRSPSVEAVMSMRDRLKLTEDQISSLDAIRAERVRERNAVRAEMEEMRSRLRAGQIPRSEMMAYMEQRREAQTGVNEARRGELEGILNETQLGTLDDMRTRARSFARGRASARGDRGVRASRGDRASRGGRSFRGSRGERSFRGARGERLRRRGGD